LTAAGLPGGTKLDGPVRGVSGQMALPIQVDRVANLSARAQQAGSSIVGQGRPD
jgi:hypothetical protein